MDLINRADLLHHLDECIAENDAQTPITNAVLLAIKCAVEQMPRVDAVKWHKVVMREMTEEEYIKSFATDIIPNDVFLCDMPKDNQEILVVRPWETEVETCIKTPYGYGTMYGSSWVDVIAWASVPKYEGVEDE